MRAWRPAVRQDSHQREHVLPELLHLAQHRLDGRAAEAEVEMPDTDLAQCLDVGGDLVGLAREQPTLAVAGLGRHLLAERRAAQRDPDGIRRASGFLRQLAQARYARLEACEAVER